MTAVPRSDADMASDTAAVRGKLEAAFKVFDKDGSGNLSAAEMMSILTRPTADTEYVGFYTNASPFGQKVAKRPDGTYLTEGEAQGLITMFDKSGDGKLNVDEFIESGTPRTAHMRVAIGFALSR